MESIQGTYDGLLVAVSIGISMLASFVALITVPRIHLPSNPRWSLVWVCLFGATMGTGIWSMHFIAMLAFELPIPVYYDATLTLASLLLAISVCALAVIPLRDQASPGGSTILQIGSLVGLGIAGMHYTGMAAMRMNASMLYDPWVVLLSIVIAMSAASAALFIVNNVREIRIATRLGGKTLAAVVMGAAVSSMHYTAMTGVQFRPRESLEDITQHIEPHLLAAAVVVYTLLILAGVFATALLDEAYAKARAIQAQAQRRSDIDQALHSILRVSLQSRPLEEMLQIILNILLDIDWLTLKKQGSIFLADTQSRRLQLMAQKQLHPELLQLCDGIAFGTCLCGKAAETREIVFKSCIDHEHSILPSTVSPHGHFCAPILDGDEVLGVLNLYVAHGHQANATERRFLESVTNAIAGIIRQKRSEEQLQALSYFDALTGLANRTLLMDRIRYAISEARRYDYRVSLLFIDLDGFKEINDHLGHQSGDQLLCEVARRLTDCVRETDTVARLGGDEFVLLIHHIRSESPISGKLAENILSQLAQPFDLDGETCTIACSIGIAEFPADASTPEDLLNKADVAMYAVKYSGKNSYIHYRAAWSEYLNLGSTELDTENATLSLLLEQLEQALEARDRIRTQGLLEQISALCHTHFSAQEAQFETTGYPESRQHAGQHQTILDALDQYQQDIARKKSGDGWMDAGRRLHGRLISHKLKQDTRYAEFLRSQRNVLPDTQCPPPPD